MTDKSTITRIFEILDEIRNGQADIRERVTRVEGKIDVVEERQASQYDQNQRDHNNIVSLITENQKDLEADITELRRGHTDQQTHLDQKHGEHTVKGRWTERLIVLIAGGGLTGIGYLILKLLQING